MVKVADELPLITDLWVLLEVIYHFLAVTAAEEFILEASVGLVPPEVCLLTFSDLHPVLSLAQHPSDHCHIVSRSQPVLTNLDYYVVDEHHPRPSLLLRGLLTFKQGCLAHRLYPILHNLASAGAWVRAYHVITTSNANYTRGLFAGGWCASFSATEHDHNEPKREPVGTAAELFQLFPGILGLPD